MRFRFTLIILPAALAITLLHAQPASAQFKPSDQYKIYLAKLYYATQLSDFADYLYKRSRENLLSIRSPREQKLWLEKYKRGYVGNFKVTKEEVVGDLAFIEGTGVGMEWGQVTPAQVRVEMVRERSTWKVLKQVWKGSVRPPKGKKGRKIRESRKHQYR